MPTATGHTTAIRASRVIGTNVYNREGEKIGEIEDLILDKLSDHIMFAVIGFGGVFSVGEKFHAIPWSVLDFVPEQGGYVVPYTREQLEAAPVSTISELTEEDGEKARNLSFDYYKVPKYW